MQHEIDVGMHPKGISDGQGIRPTKNYGTLPKKLAKKGLF